MRESVDLKDEVNFLEQEHDMVEQNQEDTEDVINELSKDGIGMSSSVNPSIVDTNGMNT